MDKNHCNPPIKKDLRIFGTVLGCLFLFFAWRAIHENGGAYKLQWGILAILFLGSTLCYPQLLRGPQRTAHSIFLAVRWCITQLILIGLFYLVITPIAFIMKIKRHDPLDRAFPDTKPSYWSPCKNPAIEKTSFEKQF